MRRATILSLPRRSYQWRSYDTRRPGAKIFLRPHQQKLQSTKWKVGTTARKNQNQNIYCLLFLFVFRSNKVHPMLETHSTKAIAVGKSNNARVWGRSPQP